MTLSLANKRSFVDNDNNPVKPIEYVTSNNNVFTGNLTNEAPSKYVYSVLAKEGNVLDTIIVLLSEECINDKKDFLNNMNTYEYFVSKIKEYLEGEYKDMYPAVYQKIIDDYQNIDNYLDKTIQTAIISSRPQDEEKMEIVNSLTSFIDKGDERNLYVDFSGGSRINGMVALTIVRIFEKQIGTTIKEVLYADINQKVNTISNINSYYLSLKALEDNALDYFKGNLASESLEVIGIKRSVEMKEVSNEVKDIINIGDSSYRKEESSELKKQIKQQEKKEIKDALGKNMQKQALRTVKTNINNPFNKLSKRSDKELIKDFHEVIIDLMIDYGYIVPSGNSSNTFKKQVKNQLKANENYYGGVISDKNKYIYQGVLPSVTEWIKNNPNVNNYNKLYEDKLNIQKSDYQGFSPNYPKGINNKWSKHFSNYYLEKDIKIDGDEIDLLLEYNRLMNVYYSYGFPFMCGDNYNNFYKEISNYYYERVKAFFNYLETYKTIKPDEIKAVIDDIKENGEDSAELKNRIPLMTKTSLWKINESKYNTKQEAEDFISMLMQRIEKTRNYRNAISHNLNNEYSDIRKQHDMAEEIREWISEYEKMCIE